MRRVRAVRQPDHQQPDGDDPADYEDASRCREPRLPKERARQRRGECAIGLDWAAGALVVFRLGREQHAPVQWRCVRVRTRLVETLGVRPVVCPRIQLDRTSGLRRQDDATRWVASMRAHGRRAPVRKAHDLIYSRGKQLSCSRNGIEPARSSSTRHGPPGHQRPIAGRFAGEWVEVEWLVLVLVAQAKYQCRRAHEMWEWSN
jgi:hypothetical protein